MAGGPRAMESTGGPAPDRPMGGSVSVPLLEGEESAYPMPKPVTSLLEGEESAYLMPRPVEWSQVAG